MTRIEESIEIEAPVEKVWAFVIDLENIAKTSPPETEIEILSHDEGPVRVGYTIKARAKLGGGM